MRNAHRPPLPGFSSTLNDCLSRRQDLHVHGGLPVFTTLRAALFAGVVLLTTGCPDKGSGMVSAAEPTRQAPSTTGETPLRSDRPANDRGANDCKSETVRDWLTSAGCLKVQRCPGVPGPCKESCVAFPSSCTACPSCYCLTRAVCSPQTGGACRAHEVSCLEE